MSRKPLISIIIANFNGKKFIKKCVQSIYKEKSANYEVIVVDDRSTDGSDKDLKKSIHHAGFSLYYTQNNRGPAHARNIGAKHGRGRYLFFLDFDTVVEQGWSRQIENFFTSHTKAGACQGKLLVMGTKKYDYAGDYLGPLGFLIERAQGAVDKGQFDNQTEIFSLKGAAMIFRKSVFEKIGGFDEDIEYLWEEPDITWRVWLSGYQVYFLPEVVVEHAYAIKPKDKTYYQARKFYYRGARNNIMSLLKNMGSEKLLFVLPLHLCCWLALVVIFLFTRNRKNGFDIIKGIWWNVYHINTTLKKRQGVQKKRTVTDQQLFKKVGAHRGLKYYLNKGMAYIKNTQY